MMQPLLFVAVLMAGTSAQFFPQQELPLGLQPPPLQQSNFAVPQQQFAAPQQFNRQVAPVVPVASVPQQQNYAHRAVVQNAASEAQLPPHLLNPFYKNQRVATALAKESWFAPGENLVVDREAEKIPRQKIYAVLKHAGFINRRRR